MAVAPIAVPSPAIRSLTKVVTGTCALFEEEWIGSDSGEYVTEVHFEPETISQP